MFWETVRRAYLEFLKIPTLVITGFLLLALLTFALDEHWMFPKNATYNASPGWFGDAQTARDVLGVIASSIITVTSITFSLLLVSVQQGAASLTSLVFDQFLRRRSNQVYFGFFVGLALYSLTVLASTNSSHHPTFGVALAGLLTVVALYMLIILIYTTIDQMRPVVIIRSIHDHALRARECQLDLLRKTRRTPRLPCTDPVMIAAKRSGFLVRVDVSAIEKALADTEIELVILASIGSYVSLGAAIAELRSLGDHDVTSIGSVIEAALALEEQRDLDSDPAFGVEQLVTIGWTSISTAKSNPDPGLLTIWLMRDLLARWLRTDAGFGASGGAVTATFPAPIVYSDDLAERLMMAFESLTVVASESMQHQCAAEVYRALSSLFPLLPPVLRQRAVEIILRSISALGDHVLTSDLERALSLLSATLTTHGQPRCADAISTARDGLRMKIGRLNSRSTRATAGGG